MTDQKSFGLLCGCLLLTVALPIRAQSSASFQLEEHSVNAGGNPAQGVALSSASYQLSVDSFGEPGLLAIGSPGFTLDAGFAGAYAPPLEVSGLVFRSNTQLAWNPFFGAGTYNVYRGALTSFQPEFGTCWQSGLTTTLVADDEPVVGSGYFYLVTAENRLAQEGTKGINDIGERSGNACVP